MSVMPNRVRQYCSSALLLFSSTVCTAEESVPVFTLQQQEAEALIAKNQGAEALKILTELVKNYPVYYVYIDVAQAYAEVNDPNASLVNFQKALAIAGTDPTRQRVALLGIGKMQLWLEKYADAEKTYTQLINSNLPDEDKKTVLDALNKARKAQGKAPETSPSESMPAQKTADMQVTEAVSPPSVTPSEAVESAETEGATTATTPEKQNENPEQTTASAQPASPTPYEEAVKYLEKNEGAKALKILDELVKQQPSFNVYVARAQAYAEIDKPAESLENYQKALTLAETNDVQKKIALFGIAKMKLWLEKYLEAKKIYEQLLESHLNAEDKKIALAGLEKAKKAIGVPAKPAPPRSKYWLAYDQAMDHLNKDEGAQALKILAALIQEEPTFLVYIAAAKASAEIDHPLLALYYYDEALDIAKEADQKHVALFGVAKTQAWLGDYTASRETYGFLVNSNLNDEDYEAAFAGLISAYANRDNPMKAYSLIPPDFNYTQGDTVLNSAQASTWSGWSQITKPMLEKNQKIIDGVEKNSRLATNLKNMQRQVAEETAKNTIAPRFYWDHDNEGFYIQKTGAQYSHRFMNDYSGDIKDSLTSVGIYNLLYSQASGFGITSGRTVGTGFFLDQRINTMHTYYQGRVGFDSLNDWNPFLWLATIGYTPNDTLRIKFNNNRDIVESFAAIEAEITAISSELQLALNPIYRLRYDGSIYYQPFSDGNKRRGFYSSVDYYLFTEIAILAEARVRGFKNSEPGSRLYYDPTSFVELTYLVKFQRHTAQNWFIHADFGLGQQNVNPGGAQPITYYEAGLTAPFAKNFTFDIMAGYTTSAFGSQNVTVNETGKYIRRFGALQLTYFGF